MGADAGYDLGDGPRGTAYQPYVRDPVLGDDKEDQYTTIRVQGLQNALQLQYDIASGAKEPFLSRYSWHINVINSTVRGVYAVEIIYQRPEADDRNSIGGVALPGGPTFAR